MTILILTTIVASLTFACGYLLRGDKETATAIHEKAQEAFKRTERLFKPRRDQIVVLSKSEPKTSERRLFERVERLCEDGSSKE